MPRIALVVSGHRAGSTLSALVLGNHERAEAVGELTKLPAASRSESVRCTCGAQPLSLCEFWGAVLRRTDESSNGAAVSGLTVASGHWLDRARMRLVGNLYGWTPGLGTARAAAGLLGAGPRIGRLTGRTFEVYDAIFAAGRLELIVDSDKSAWRAKALWAARPEQCRIVYLARDARGVVRSLLSQGGGHAWSHNARDAARYWVWENRRIQRVLRTLPREAWTLLRYEDLCRDPEATLRATLDFLGLAFDPGMVELARRPHHLLGGNRMRFRGDSTIRLDEKWRRVLDSAQLSEIERVAGRLNRELGYA